MAEKAEPFGFRRGTVTVQSPPIELNPEIVLPEITIPEIKIPEIKIPEIKMPDTLKMPDINPQVTVEAPKVAVNLEPTFKVEPIIRIETPEAHGWKFTIHRLKNGDIEMTAKPIKF